MNIFLIIIMPNTKPHLLHLIFNLDLFNVSNIKSKLSRSVYRVLYSVTYGVYLLLFDYRYLSAYLLWLIVTNTWCFRIV